MDKQALKVDMGTVGRFGLGGLVTGVGTASLLNLIHTLREQRKEQKELAGEQETDKDTIVVNLPPKKGAYLVYQQSLRDYTNNQTAKAAPAQPTQPPAASPIPSTPPIPSPKPMAKPPKASMITTASHTLTPRGAEVVAKFAYHLKQVSMISSKATKVDKKTKAGGRKPEGKKGGQFDNPVKVTDSENASQDESNGEATKTATGWPTMTMGALAALGGTGAGVALVDKLYQMRREKMLKQELEASQQEYLKTLAGKQASAIDEFFPIAMDKQAGIEHTFGLLNYPMAAAALLTLMGTGGTAYITKRILDEKLREAREKGLDMPKVKRIVFKTAPTAGAKPEEEEAPEDMKLASAQDIMNIKAALFIMMDKLDTHTRVLGTPGVKEAQAAAGLPTNKLFNLSEGDIGTIMSALDKNPELARVIVRQGMARRPIMKHFQWLANTRLGLGLGKSRIRNFLSDFMAPQAPAMQPKVANFAETAAALMLGKTMGSGTGDAAKALLEDDKREIGPQNEAGKPKIDLSKITVTAKDPAAAEYLRINKQKVIKILQRMADEGKI